MSENSVTGKDSQDKSTQESNATELGNTKSADSSATCKSEDMQSCTSTDGMRSTDACHPEEILLPIDSLSYEEASWPRGKVSKTHEAAIDSYLEALCRLPDSTD